MLWIVFQTLWGHIMYWKFLHNTFEQSPPPSLSYVERYGGNVRKKTTRSPLGANQREAQGGSGAQE